MENPIRSVALSFRRIIRRKTYSLVIIFCLALGIGANTAIFSIINTLLLRPLPIKDIDQVAFTLEMRGDNDPFEACLLNALTFKSDSKLFSEIGLGRYQVFRMLGREKPERITGAAISSDYLSTLGVKPVLGRSILPEDDQPGKGSVALLNQGLWRTLFNSDPNILGKNINLNNQTYTIVGILPEKFDLPLGTRVWIPLAINIETTPLPRQAAHEYFLVARLKPGVTFEQANVDVKRIGSKLEQTYPELRRGWSTKLIPLRQQLLGDITGHIRPTLFLLMGIVGFLLLITCVNVASLLLARSIERSHETTIQLALGAGKRHLISQYFTESIILSLIGGIIGLFLARLVVSGMVSLKPVYFFALKDVFQDIRIDVRVLGFTLLVSILTGALFGLAPVIRTLFPGNLADSLKDGGQRAGGSSGGRRMFNALIIGEIAVAAILMIGTALMVMSFQRLNQAKLGFRPDRLLMMEMYVPESDYPDAAQKVKFTEDVLSKIGNIPDIASAGISTGVPLALSSQDSSFVIEGKPPVDLNEVPITSHRLVTPKYMETLGVTLISGRLINEQDRADTTPVVVISKEFAKRAWPGEDPIGKRVKPGRQPAPTVPWYTIVGMVDDVKEDRFNFRINRPVWYIPFTQRATGLPLMLLVKTTSDSTAVTGSIRNAILSINRNQIISEPKTMDEQITDFLGPQKFTALLSTLFAFLGLILAAIGIYGVTSYAILQQTKEFCIRLALGAQWRDLVKIVLKRGIILALIGLLIGSAGGYTLGRILSGLLYEVNPSSPEVIIFPSSILLFVVLVALYIPLFRLSKLNPNNGLRED